MSKLLPIILLVIGLIIAVYLVGGQTFLRSKASPLTTPQNISFSNITDNSYTVSWTTSEPALGFVSYGESAELGSAAEDDRDDATRLKRLTHHVTLKNLTPDTIYYFKIGSAGDIYDNQGQPYQQSTAPTATETPGLFDPAFGKISLNDGQPAAEALVYVLVDQGTLLSTYTDQGKWLIPLGNVRTQELNTYLPLSSDMTTEIQVIGNGIKTTQTVPVSELVAGFSLSLQPETVPTIAAPTSVLTEVVLITPTPTITATRNDDRNGDGKVNVIDWLIMLRESYQ